VYILPLGTAHIEETFFKVVLCIDALRGEVKDEAVSPCLGSGKGLQADCDGVRELLGQQVPCGEILELPIGDVLPLVVRDLGWVLGRGAGDGALKVGPPPGYLHRFTESHDEDGPIGAICFEAWDFGGKKLDGGRSSH